MIILMNALLILPDLGLHGIMAIGHPKSRDTMMVVKLPAARSRDQQDPGSGSKSVGGGLSLVREID